MRIPRWLWVGLFCACAAHAASELRLPQGYGSSVKLHVVTEQDINDPTVPPGPYQNVWGVFIGVTRYKYEPYNTLKNPGHDAQDLCQAFQAVADLREPVVLLDEDATLANIQAKLIDIGQKCGRGDLFIFHFSGHGIGLREEDAPQSAGGWMFLHDAAAQVKMTSGQSEVGLLDMRSLTQLTESCGIKAKHQLFILDCCYSGMAVRSRDLGGIGSIDRHLRKKACYVITAGGAGQPVLDGVAVGQHGHGLLTGLFIDALRHPAQYHLETERTSDGAEWLSLERFMMVCNRQIPNDAERMLTAFAGARASGETRRLASRDAAQPALEPSERLPNPQEPQSRLEGEGRVYIPLRHVAGALAPSSAGTATNPPPDALTPSKLMTTNRPVLTSEAWAERAGLKFKSAEYGTLLNDIFKLLQQGQPPAPTQPAPVAIQAELCSRPHIPKTAWPEWATRLGCAVGAPMLEQARFLERSRMNIPNMHWRPLRPSGDYISENFEYRWVIKNRAKTPMYYYLIGLDEAGILQWLAPRNNSWHDDQYPDEPLTFGESPLPLQGGLIIPPNLNQMAAWITCGQPVEGLLDQQFFLVASASEWTELRNRLERASSLACKLADIKSLAALKVGALPEQQTLRAVGGWNMEPAVTTVEAQSSGAAPPLIARTDGGLLVQSWIIHVLPADKLDFSLEPVTK